ncbi:hypothetical protein [Bradyrhizobium cenepequi]|uniref:hypothetical protein n=1 Tax=Bradyrhizobium cenepequi TaxID=2821403 RepID=UPI001CE3A08F|nr:hypothetical protein [Bradyrhizobium cenepequi]MCA6113145.1 hypothetical protein [Bradyrhizobium cenepequi]
MLDRASERDVARFKLLADIARKIVQKKPVESIDHRDSGGGQSLLPESGPVAACQAAGTRRPHRFVDLVSGATLEAKECNGRSNLRMSISPI